MNILLLREADIRAAFNMSDAVTAAADALAAYSQGGCEIPLRANLNVPQFNGQSLYMPGYAPQADALGVKIVSVYPENIAKGLTSVPATMVLLNEKTGEVCALMDGTWLTRLRTGAVSGAATRLLARSDAEIGALFGTGGQAETQLEAMLTVRPGLREVRVFDVMQERARAFAAKMQSSLFGKFSTRIYAGETSDTTVQDADIVTTVTTSPRPVFRGELLKDGAHVNAVGAYTPAMQEIDATVLKRAGKIYVDTRDGALNESGDFLVPFGTGELSREAVTGELGELVLGRTPGRTCLEEITVFETVGSAVLDIVTARRIYNNAVVQGIGQIIEM